MKSSVQKKAQARRIIFLLRFELAKLKTTMIVGEQVTTVTVTTTTGSAGAMEAAAAPPAYTTTTTETTEKTVQEQPRPSQGYSVDTTYPRSLEGILRIITVVRSF